MSEVRQRWFRNLHSSSLFRPVPLNADQRQIEVLAYVELFAQFASDDFVDDIGELVRSRYPSEEACLLDEVLATFILHHPEHGHAVLHALLSCIIDGTLIYDKKSPPFSSFISLFCPSNEKDFSEQWALACGETLRVLTHYNRPVYKVEVKADEFGSSNAENVASSSKSVNAPPKQNEERVGHSEQEKKLPTRLLTPWITDSLLAAPLGIRSDYFRWCGGVMGKYAAGGELKPPTTAVGARGPGKRPQLMPSTPRWAVANGAAVILSVCDDEVVRYEAADLTAAAVPALLLPPPATAVDEHLVAGLPPLEPYARLFHRYYAIATPGATQRLFLGLLEAPPSWAPDALDAAVQLIELLRAAEDYGSPMQLPRNWLHLHFLRAVGAAITMNTGVVSDAASAFLFRVFSQPALLFPPPGHAQGVQGRHNIYGSAIAREQMENAASKACQEATAQGIASLMSDHGSDIEWRICALWEAAYGLVPLNSSTVNLPELVVTTAFQPPALSWNVFRPFVLVQDYLPRGSTSESCLLRIFTATVEAILHRTFPLEEDMDQKQTDVRATLVGPSGINPKNLAITELRSMIHSLFTDDLISPEIAAQLLSVILTVCLNHDVIRQGHKKGKPYKATTRGGGLEESQSQQQQQQNHSGRRSPYGNVVCKKDRGAVAVYDSYVVAAVCALACEVQMLSFSSQIIGLPTQGALLAAGSMTVPKQAYGFKNISGTARNGVLPIADHARRFLNVLEVLVALGMPTLSIVSGGRSNNSGEIVAAAVVSAHISKLLGMSKACTHALTSVVRCNWDSDLCARATSLLTLIKENEKTVSSVVVDFESDTSKNLDSKMREEDAVPTHKARVQMPTEVSHPLQYQTSDVFKTCDSIHRIDMTAASSDTSTLSLVEEKVDTFLARDAGKGSLESLPFDSSDMADLLCVNLDSRVNGNVGSLVKAVLIEKEDLSLAAIPLLWQRLLFLPEVPTMGESTSANRGWRQVVDALCNIVVVFPVKAATAIVFQADRDLQPWAGTGDGQDLEPIWRINRRIVNLLYELLRLHTAPEALEVVAKASSLLHKATDGLTVDGEACALPQLELLEAAVSVVHTLCGSGSSSYRALESIKALLMDQLPAVVRCLSHSSAHVRVMSISLLRDLLQPCLFKAGNSEKFNSQQKPEEGTSSREKLANSWPSLVQQCFDWELHNLHAMGMSTLMLTNAAYSLGFSASA